MESDSLGLHKMTMIGYMARLHPHLINCTTLKQLLVNALNNIHLDPILAVELDPSLKEFQSKDIMSGGMYMLDPPPVKLFTMKLNHRQDKEEVSTSIIGIKCIADKVCILKEFFSQLGLPASYKKQIGIFILTGTMIQANIRDAYKCFHKLKADLDSRDTWISNLIHAQAQAMGTSTKSLWKQHRQAEKVRHTARLVRSALRMTPHPGALQAVTSPASDGQLQEFSTKYLLEKACLEEAGHRFSQANDTPLLQIPILQNFGEIGTNHPAFKKVLEGKYQPSPDKNIYVRKLLQQLKQPMEVRDFPLQSLQEYMDRWRKS